LDDKRYIQAMLTQMTSAVRPGSLGSVISPGGLGIADVERPAVGGTARIDGPSTRG
jgi:hypothetical protein